MFHWSLASLPRIQDGWRLPFPSQGRHLSGGKRCCHAPFWVSLWSERLSLLPALASGRVERRLWKTEPVLMRWETLEVDPKVHPSRCKSLLRNRTHPVPHKNTGPAPRSRPHPLAPPPPPALPNARQTPPPSPPNEWWTLPSPSPLGVKAGRVHAQELAPGALRISSTVGSARWAQSQSH